MLIDKSKGNWCKEGESDDIDDVAFQIYLNYFYKEYGEFNEDSPQSNFKKVRYVYPHSYWYRYYENAFKIVRLEKLEKLEKYNDEKYD